MSFFDDASLVMIPSGYKDQKVYSVKPIDGNGDLTFSRGSDIEATRVASNGFIQKAAVNLLLQSNTYNTSWTATNATLTSGQSGYDGSNDAWLLQNTTSASTYIAQNPSTSGVVTFSVYAKAGSVNWVRISTSGFANGSYFNLTDGTMGVSSGLIARTITSVGGGWYRITITHTGTTGMFIFTGSADNTLAQTAGDNIYIQDAQINYGLVAQEYQETTTTTVVSGITNDMPRLDYSGGASCPSALLEPSRQNLVTQSEYFPNIGTGLSATNNFSTSPEGVSNSTKLTELAGTNTKLVTIDSVSYTSGTTYTHSFFAKSTSRYIQMYFSNSIFTNDYANFDLVNGVVGGKSGDVTSSIEDYGNGWFRCIATIAAPVSAAASNLLLLIDDVNATRGQSYTGDGSSFAEIYGFQCEAGSYPTSYIPTYGTSNSRTADACSKTGISSLLNDSEGTFFVEIESLSTDSATKVITIGDGTSLNRVQIFYQAGTNITTNLISGGTPQVTGFTTATSQTDNHKVLIRYASNNAKMYLDGVEIASDTSVITPTGLNKISFDNGTGTSDFQGKLKQLLYFPTALSDADCIALTQ